MTKPITHEFTIDRAKWLSGHHEERDAKFGFGTASMLCDVLGRMCCLGFYLESCGMHRMNMLNRPNPSDLANFGVEIPPKAAWLLYEDQDEEGNPKHAVLGLPQKVDAEPIRMNDGFGRYRDLTPAEREAAIAAFFADNGVKVNYVGEYPVAAPAATEAA